ncbi:MAG: SCP2 sterol-binding domain-containing protein [Solirubrobacterales bacterium]
MKFGLLDVEGRFEAHAAQFDRYWNSLDDDPQWARCRGLVDVQRAAKKGVGAFVQALKTPEDAAELVVEYDRALQADDAVPISDDVNASVAVVLVVGDANADVGEIVGLVERYRQAGVDEVFFSLPYGAGSDIVELLTTGVLPEFDDEEVRQAAETKAALRAPAIAAAVERRRPARDRPSVRRKKQLLKRMDRFQRSAVKRMSDRQLELAMGNRLGIRTLFKAMAKMYRPRKAGDFIGEIEFTLETPHGKEVWTIDCQPSGAQARRGSADNARLHVKSGVADFLRLGTGDLSAPNAIMSGKVEVRGDFQVAVRMGEMFGAARMT